MCPLTVISTGSTTESLSSLRQLFYALKIVASLFEHEVHQNLQIFEHDCQNHKDKKHRNRQKQNRARPAGNGISEELERERIHAHRDRKKQHERGDEHRNAVAQVRENDERIHRERPSVFFGEGILFFADIFCDFVGEIRAFKPACRVDRLSVRHRPVHRADAVYHAAAQNPEALGRHPVAQAAEAVEHGIKEAARLARKFLRACRNDVEAFERFSVHAHDFFRVKIQHGRVELKHEVADCKVNARRHRDLNAVKIAHVED